MSESENSEQRKRGYLFYIAAAVFWLGLIGSCVWTGLSAISECFGNCKFYDWTINDYTACDHPDRENDVLAVNDVAAQSLDFHTAQSEGEVNAVYAVDADGAIICAINREWENDVPSWAETGNYRLWHYDVYDEAAVFRNWFLTDMQSNTSISLAPPDTCCFVWSADETRVAFVVRPIGERVGTLRVYDGIAEAFTEVDYETTLATWSPNGDYLVFALPDGVVVANRDLEVLDRFSFDDGVNEGEQLFTWIDDGQVRYEGNGTGSGEWNGEDYDLVYGRSCVVDVVALTMACESNSAD